MQFKDKLNLLLTTLSITNITLARESGLDASLVSRYRTGARIPTRNSASVHTLCRGLSSLILSNQVESSLRSLLNIKVDDIPFAVLYDHLFQWLNAPDSQLRNEKKPAETLPTFTTSKRSQTSLPLFSEKLDILMSAMNISNIRLARSINVDNSLISRLRNGVRIPNESSEIIHNITIFFVNHTKTQQQIHSLLDVLDLPINTDSVKATALESALYGWLNENQSASHLSTNHLLLKLDHLAYEPLPSTSDVEYSLTAHSTNDETRSYWGHQGIRQALFQLLSEIESQPIPRTIYFYTDQNVDWMTEDENYYKTMQTLLLHLLTKGNRMVVIHATKHNLSDLLVTIENWLPFYLTGSIEPYYCPDLNNIFKRTLIVADSFAYISSTCMENTEPSAEYIYGKSTPQLTFQTDQFKAFLHHCNPLMKIFTTSNAEQFFLREAEFDRKDGTYKTLLHSLSLYTMPRELFIGILERNDIPKKETEALLSYFNSKTKKFFKTILTSSYIELASLMDESSVEVDEIPVDFPPFILTNTVYYTLKEYHDHVNHIMLLMKTYPNYEMRSLSSTPLQKVHIIGKPSIGVIVIKKDLLGTVFKINQEQTCKAFHNYLDYIDDTYSQPLSFSTLPNAQ